MQASPKCKNEPKKIALGFALLLGLVAALGCANSGEGESDHASAVAQLDGEPITLEAVDNRIKSELFTQKFPAGQGDSALYSARREAIMTIVDEKLLIRNAEAANLSPEDWMTAQLAELPPVTDSDVGAFFAENQERFPPEATLDALSGPIREYLAQKNQEGVRTKLREEASLNISLPRDRTPVAAVGPALGPETAAVTIIEFSDFQCPYCARVAPTIHEIAARYPEDVRIVFRHLPLSFHGEARGAAYASICAGEQDQFWEYHDLLFANQRALQEENLMGYAETLELDMASFEACMVAPETEALVAADIEAAGEVGATGTPAFFVNGVFISGAQPIEVFDGMIQEELAGAGG
ncbi:MAG: thioredoxin domain-containing protein [Myxococcota bacterium]|nr:thioredoxin domain-containing protein [Myxococcota bacterium]